MKIIDSKVFSDNTYYGYSRFELLELEDGRVLSVNCEDEDVLDLEEDEYDLRYKFGQEVTVEGTFDELIEEGISKGYFFYEDSDDGDILYDWDNSEQMCKWLGVEL